MQSPKVIRAIDAYKSLQYNPKIEVARSYQRKIDKYLSEIDTDDSPTSVKKKMDVIRELRVNIKELENEVEASTIKKGMVKGKQDLSYLEELMSNRKNYLAVTSQKK